MSDDYDDISLDSSGEFSFPSTGEAVEDKETFLSQLFNTSNRIEILRRSLRGESPKGDGTWIKVPKELAGDNFINKQISSIKSIINDTNTFTRKDDKECKRILKDSVDAFLLDAWNDETVDTKDIRTLSKIYEHALELFLGLVEFGHGAKVLNAALNGHHLQQDSRPVKETGIMDFLRGK